MAKISKKNYVCQACGSISNKWTGKCDTCGNWNTLVEELNSKNPHNLGSKKGKILELVDISKAPKPKDLIVSQIVEFDRVCGGGLVTGSAILLAGDPGIGKSTLLLQLLTKYSKLKHQCVYISGEEAISQIKLRAKRLGIDNVSLSVYSTTDVRNITTTLNNFNSPSVLVIDSIQTMFVDSLESAPGTVSQVRTSAQEIIRCAKHLNIAVILVGHVTKEGQIAGPRVLEHMVDTVLYFEGEQSNQHRILRSVKNRFGPTDEIGVFEMTPKGLSEVKNPSQLFLTSHNKTVNGAAVFAGIEGKRPILVEIQALVANSQLGTARRAVVGWDSGRLAMILAVLETNCGIPFGSRDVYLNVAGGLKINEPGADLAVTAAILSSHFQTPLEEGTIIFGEIGLSGEIRIVKQTNLRLKEASKLGFKIAFAPKGKYENSLIEVNQINELSELKNYISSLKGKFG